MNGIRHFVVTYRGGDLLRASLASLGSKAEDVTVIDNGLEDGWAAQPAKYWPNLLRHPLSTGHLARSWNQAIMFGFGSLTEPAAEAVVLAQHDILYLPDFYEHVEQALKEGLDFVSWGPGDACMLITPRCVREVGLFDERFCVLCYQEADYFVRARWALGARASINDAHHARVFNPRPTALIETPPGHPVRGQFPDHLYYLQDLFCRKWGCDAKAAFASEVPLACALPQPILYPWFEGTSA